MAQWSRLYASNTGATSLIPGWGTPTGMVKLKKKKTVHLEKHAKFFKISIVFLKHNLYPLNFEGYITSFKF